MSTTRFELAKKAFEDESYAEALVMLVPFVLEENAEALGLVGVAHQLGLGVAPDGMLAVSLLTRASELGNGVAAHNLGTIYVTGAPGIEPNYALSKYWYCKAKALGSQFAPEEFYEFGAQPSIQADRP